jgi:sarcosine oxidase
MIDVIVIGLGVYGLALVRELAEAGRAVVGLEQFCPDHDRGSSHGETRIFRFTTLDSDAYVPLAREADAIWESLQRSSGITLKAHTGLAVIAEPGTARQRHHGKADILTRASALARRESIPFSVVDGATLQSRYPDIACSDRANVFIEDSAYVLASDRCLQVLRAASVQAGADLQYNVEATGWTSNHSSATVSTSDGRVLHAKRLIFSLGPYLQEQLPHLADQLTVRPQAVQWRESPPDVALLPFISTTPDQPLFFAIPGVFGKTDVKVVAENEYASATTVRTITQRTAHELDAATTELTAKHLPRIRSSAIARQTCFYTTTPDGLFRQGYADRNQRVQYISACSGHGFKFAPALARRLTQPLIDA